MCNVSVREEHNNVKIVSLRKEISCWHTTLYIVEKFCKGLGCLFLRILLFTGEYALTARIKEKGNSCKIPHSVSPHKMFSLYAVVSMTYRRRWAPGPVPFGTCICSNVETILSWTCHVYGPFEFRTSLGTSILLLIYRGPWMPPPPR